MGRNPPHAFNQQRPTSVRPQMAIPIPQDRPHTALGHQAEFHGMFERNVPARKSGGFISRLKKSFGKGKSKKNIRRPVAPSRAEPHLVEISAPTEVSSSLTQSPVLPAEGDFHQREPPPDIWLSGRQPLNPEIAKPVPRKPPRRSRSKSNSGMS